MGRNQRVRDIAVSLGFTKTWLWDVDSLGWRPLGNTQVVITEVTSASRPAASSRQRLRGSQQGAERVDRRQVVFYGQAPPRPGRSPTGGRY